MLDGGACELVAVREDEPQARKLSHARKAFHEPLDRVVFEQ